MPQLITIHSAKRTSAPAWALLERQLFQAMEEAGPLFLAKYTRENGELIWKDTYPGDGVWADDLYESFFNWPTLYALGGSEWFKEMAFREWEAITRQVTRYGRASKEFINDDDWFHNGENYIYFYALGLADPHHQATIERSRRFAGFYLNEDPEAPNYDPHYRIVRSPFNGSKGPLHHARFADVRYNLVHHHTTLGPRYTLPPNWLDDPQLRRQVHQQFDEVVMR